MKMWYRKLQGSIPSTKTIYKLAKTVRINFVKFWNLV